MPKKTEPPVHRNGDGSVWTNRFGEPMPRANRDLIVRGTRLRHATPQNPDDTDQTPTATTLSDRDA